MKYTLIDFIKGLIQEASYADAPVTFSFKSMKPWKNPTTGKWYLYFNSVKNEDGEFTGIPNQIVYLDSLDKNYEFDAKYLNYNNRNNSVSIPLFMFQKQYPNDVDALFSKTSTSSGDGVNSKTIRAALEMAFPDNWKPQDKVFSAGLRDVYPIGDKTSDGETWSVMNFFDTKKEIHDMLNKKWESEGKPGDVVEWMSNTFKSDKGFVQMLVDRQWQSIKNGIETEKRITASLADKIGGNVIFFPPGSIMDRYNGIDAIINGKSFQIKPLKKIVKRNGDYIVSTYGMQNYAQKNTDYMVYGNEKGDYFVFPNDGYEVKSSSEVVHHFPPVEEF